VLVDQKPADVSADRDKRQLADQHPIRASRGSTASVAALILMALISRARARGRGAGGAS
jgi:hypothetical protein